MRNSARLAGIVLALVTMAAHAQTVVPEGPAEQAGPSSTPRVVASPIRKPIGVDYQNAKPMPLPTSRRPVEAREGAPAPAETTGSPGFRPGHPGTGIRSPVVLTKPKPLGNAIVPQEHGTFVPIPFTTSRVNAIGNSTVAFYPFRAAGKLFVRVGASTATCSAALIAPAIVVTAAHCIAEYGRNMFYSGWVFVPAYDGGLAPYGLWAAEQAFVLASFFQGTDFVPFSNDIGILRLQKNDKNQYPGPVVGYFSYGWSGYGFTPDGFALISALGYPGALDNGELMERTDSRGQLHIFGSGNTNILIGTLQAHGSSGGPWLVNLGAVPTRTGATAGVFPRHNTVVGVTSWGPLDANGKPRWLALASSFTSDNIVPLVNAACTNAPAGAC